MTNLTKEDLEEFATACRLGIEGWAESTKGWFRNFPKGTCGDVSHIIGMHLQRRLGIEAQWVSAQGHPQLKPQQTHAWIEVCGFVVDITYDQFKSTGLSGWVFLLPGAWHGKFASREGSPVVTTPPMDMVDAYRATSAALDRIPRFSERKS